MPNHFHLLVFQKDRLAMTRLMRAILTSYCWYFNRTYNHTGALLESRYKAAYIKSESHLEHISKYIHCNPKSWQNYEYTSLPYFQGQKSAEWLKPNRIISMLGGIKEYNKYLTEQ